jgi:hypothetical protein
VTATASLLLIEGLVSRHTLQSPGESSVQRATPVYQWQPPTWGYALHPRAKHTGRKSPGNEAESASLKGQDPHALLSRGAAYHSYSHVGQWASAHQLNGAYSCTEALTPPRLHLEEEVSLWQKVMAVTSPAIGGCGRIHLAQSVDKEQAILMFDDCNSICSTASEWPSFEWKSQIVGRAARSCTAIWQPTVSMFTVASCSQISTDVHASLVLCGSTSRQCSQVPHLPLTEQGH